MLPHTAARGDAIDESQFVCRNCHYNVLEKVGFLSFQEIWYRCYITSCLCVKLRLFDIDQSCILHYIDPFHLRKLPKKSMSCILRVFVFHLLWLISIVIYAIMLRFQKCFTSLMMHNADACLVIYWSVAVIVVCSLQHICPILLALFLCGSVLFLCFCCVVFFAFYQFHLYH